MKHNSLTRITLGIHFSIRLDKLDSPQARLTYLRHFWAFCVIINEPLQVYFYPLKDTRQVTSVDHKDNKLDKILPWILGFTLLLMLHSCLLPKPMETSILNYITSAEECICLRKGLKCFSSKIRDWNYSTKCLDVVTWHFEKDQMLLHWAMHRTMHAFITLIILI